ncbi:hypothetical protein SAMN04489867_0430 [Pedococcus dokdonensis]|uniref:Uncharacterized protein n=1 Tax=Pedococcus dokdonensis TaxID=443156 RepID=A0A1H0LXV7_9MICO|nr:hypothetical protein [Pedococcus dokdonensis]SDO72913.1 hypothetical protein SAMN04489867_0430 [Pedococcus dokdonensis]
MPGTDRPQSDAASSPSEAAGSPSDAASSPSTYRRARRAVGRWRRSVADPNNLAAKVDKQRAQLDRQSTQIAELKASVAALGKRLHPVEYASKHREVEHGGLAIQVGVVEERLGRIEEALRREEFVGDEGDEGDRAEARSLVEAVRREHEQVRVRMQVIAQYEERLRRLEEAVAKAYDGDVRHPF